MRELTDEALNIAQTLGAEYADIRIENSKSESITVKNGQLEDITASEGQGFGVRVLKNGSWGFAASFMISNEEIQKVTKKAIKIAEASSLVQGKRVKLAPVKAVEDSYVSKVIIDPFKYPLEKKLELLFNADSIMRKNNAIKLSKSSLDFYNSKKIFASTEGSYINQDITETGGAIIATAIKEGEVQHRSYPNSHRGDFANAGYEFVDEMDLAGHAERVASEAQQLLSAKQCPSGEMDIILDGSQLALQVHESCGHPTELDRVLGMEASYAGTSFLTMDKLNKFKYGSEIINIYADATIPGALGSFAYDDEGVPAQRSEIIKNGLFVGYLTSRETAPVIGKEPNGTMRADGWINFPLIRMTNINLAPGDVEIEELFEGINQGIYMETNSSWSIDDKRLNFQFATEIGWEIKNGKKTQMLKNCNYNGITYKFWDSCDAIANQKFWKVWGLPNCGKGEPSQIAHVAHGTSPARFRKVKVGVGQ